MASSNGQATIPDLLGEYQREWLSATQQFSDAVVAAGKGYQQATEIGIRFSFAQWKALSNFAKLQGE